MTTKDDVSSENLDKMQANLQRVEALTERLMLAISGRKAVNPTLSGPGTELYAQAAVNYWAEMVENPKRIYEHQLEYWGRSVQHFVAAQEAFATEGFKAPADHTGADKRFGNPLWQTHPYFNFVKQQYLINSDAIRKAVEDVEDMDPKDKRRDRKSVV